MKASQSAFAWMVAKDLGAHVMAADPEKYPLVSGRLAFLNTEGTCDVSLELEPPPTLEHYEEFDAALRAPERVWERLHSGETCLAAAFMSGDLEVLGDTQIAFEMLLAGAKARGSLKTK